MRSRVHFGCPLVLVSVWLLSSCAGTSTSTTATAPTPADTAAADTTRPPPPPPAEATFQPSAPNEVVSEATLTRRRIAVSDMLRLRTISAIQQGPLGLLRTAVGDSFHTSSNRDRQYPRLALAYSTWTEPGSDLVIEIWDRGRKIGEFTDGAFLMGPEYSAPRGCEGPGPGGICGYAEGGEPPPVTAPPAAAVTRAPAPTTSEARGHRGIHVNLGVGAGAADIVCEGCDIPSETALSGFAGIGHSVSENSVAGVEVAGWRSSEDPDTRLFSLMGTGTVYLNETSGVFLTAGIGLFDHRQHTPGGDLEARTIGYTARLGYEFRTAGRLTVSPYAAFISTFRATEFELDGVRTGEFNFNILQAGLAIGLN
jgi:hypothetical protein